VRLALNEQDRLFEGLVRLHLRRQGAGPQKPTAVRQCRYVLQHVGIREVEFSPQRDTREQTRANLGQLVDGTERDRVFDQRPFLGFVPTDQTVHAAIDQQDPVDRQMLDEEAIVLE
jgi:hypothetical protein